MALECGFCRGTGEVLVNVIPAGAQGNVGAVPLYDFCSCQTGQALVAAVRERQVQQQQAAAERAQAAQQEAADRDETVRHIKRFAAALHDRRVPGAVEREWEVGTRGWGPFRKALYDHYAPAWPVPDQLFRFGETHTSGDETRRSPTGVTRGGDIVHLRLPLNGERPVWSDLPDARSRWTPDVTGVQRKLEDLKVVANALDRLLDRTDRL